MDYTFPTIELCKALSWNSLCVHTFMCIWYKYKYICGSKAKKWERKKFFFYIKRFEGVCKYINTYKMIIFKEEITDNPHVAMKMMG